MKTIIFIIFLITNVFCERIVCLTFDGGYNLTKWDEIVNFCSNQNIKCTIFIPACYLITIKELIKYNKNYIQYNNTNVSTIKFSSYTNYNLKIINKINIAIKNGNEIGSHGVGHFDGTKFNYNNWLHEFEIFHWIISSIEERYNIKTLLLSRNIISYRAPELGYNQDLFKVMDKFNYKYDSSSIVKIKDQNIKSFPISSYSINNTNIILMDYNFYFKDKDVTEDRYKEVEENMFNHMKYFYNNIKIDEPMIIGFHFSQWNGDAYWKACKKFIIHAKSNKAIFKKMCEL